MFFSSSVFLRVTNTTNNFHARNVRWKEKNKRTRSWIVCIIQNGGGLCQRIFFTWDWENIFLKVFLIRFSKRKENRKWNIFLDRNLWSLQLEKKHHKYCATFSCFWSCSLTKEEKRKTQFRSELGLYNYIFNFLLDADAFVAFLFVFINASTDGEIYAHFFIVNVCSGSK